MAIIRDLTVLVELTNKRIPVREVDGSVTAQELLNSLAEKINLPARTKGVLTRKLTHRQILPNQSLAAAGVEDGEVLIADFERTAG